MNKMLISLLSASIILTSCSQADTGNTPVAAYPKATVGVSISSIATNPFFQGMHSSFEKIGKDEPNLSLYMESADNDQQKQNMQLDAMLQKGAKALVVNLVDVSIGKEFVNKYCTQNVPVVFFNRNPGDKNLASCKTAYFVDGDANQAGVLQGLQVLKNWKAHPEWDKNKDGVIEYAILQGIPGHPGSESRTKWSIGTMQNYPNLGLPVREIFREHAMFQAEKAQEITQQWIEQPQFQEIEVILANNDTMALGAIEALKANQIKLPVFGIDGSTAALAAIKNGDMAATIFNDYDNQAKTALRLAANLAAGQEPMSGISYKMEYKVIQIPYQELN